jgi:hypothetical protein
MNITNEDTSDKKIMIHLDHHNKLYSLNYKNIVFLPVPILRRSIKHLRSETFNLVLSCDHLVTKNDLVIIVILCFMLLIYWENFDGLNYIKNGVLQLIYISFSIHLMSKYHKKISFMKKDLLTISNIYYESEPNIKLVCRRIFKSMKLSDATCINLNKFAVRCSKELNMNWFHRHAYKIVQRYSFINENVKLMYEIARLMVVLFIQMISIHLKITSFISISNTIVWYLMFIFIITFQHLLVVIKMRQIRQIVDFKEPTIIDSKLITINLINCNEDIPYQLSTKEISELLGDTKFSTTHAFDYTVFKMKKQRIKEPDIEKGLPNDSFENKAQSDDVKL